MFMKEIKMYIINGNRRGDGTKYINGKIIQDFMKEKLHIWVTRLVNPHSYKRRKQN